MTYPILNIHFNPYSGNGMTSLPVDLYFDGWRSDTLSLQNAGWSFCLGIDAYYQQYYLSLRSPDNKMHGITESFFCKPAFNNISIDKPCLQVKLATEIHIRAGCSTIDNWYAVDMTPQMMEYQVEYKRMSNICPFAPVQTKQLIVPEHNVDELLAMILEKQKPIREDILKKSVIEESYNRKVHAQLISVRI